MQLNLGVMADGIRNLKHRQPDIWIEYAFPIDLYNIFKIKIINNNSFINYNINTHPQNGPTTAPD